MGIRDLLPILRASTTNSFSGSHAVKLTFPSHMQRGFRLLDSKHKKIDFFIEVHDCRIPLIGRNKRFQFLAEEKAKILVFSKIDLVTLDLVKVWRAHFEKNGLSDVYFCNLCDPFDPDVKRLISRIKKINKEILNKPAEVQGIILGIPNSGKSTLINRLLNIIRGKKNAARTGQLPGVTRAGQKFLIHNLKKIYMYDTPGIVRPNVDLVEKIFLLSLVGAFPDSTIDRELLADYLLHVLNVEQEFKYVEVYRLSGPTYDINQLLRKISAAINKFLKGGVHDTLTSAIHFLKLFRTGKLGKFVLRSSYTENEDLEDTEFPGTVARPYNFPRASLEYTYQLLRCNVDLLKIIQLGLTFSDEDGNVPEGTCTWQFNFEFTLGGDMYAPDSIDLLKRSGINFEKHSVDGIDVQAFGELLFQSGSLLNPEVKWISFQGYMDYGYLIKILTCKKLPLEESEFLKVLELYFPSTYDIKYLMRSCKKLKGGLQDVADDMEVNRIGPQHQAGSDSLLTCVTFFKMRRMFFEDRIDDEKYKNRVFGLGSPHTTGPNSHFNFFDSQS